MASSPDALPSDAVRSRQPGTSLGSVASCANLRSTILGVEKGQVMPDALISKWHVTVVIALLGIMVPVGGWLGGMTIAANDKATKAQNAVDTYIAKNEERSIAIQRSLERIERVQTSINTRLNDLLETKGE